MPGRPSVRELALHGEDLQQARLRQDPAIRDREGPGNRTGDVSRTHVRHLRQET